MRRRSVLIVGVGMTALALSQVGTGRAAKALTPAVQAGTAAAQAAVLGDAPVVSGLSLTSTYGEANAAYEEEETQATSANINLGGLGALLSDLHFCGSKGLPKGTIPEPLTADSSNGPSSQQNTSNGVAREQVTVNPDPEMAQATTSAVAEQLPGLLAVTGHSLASVHYLTGLEQEADSTVTESVTLLGGLVQLNGLTWTASMHRGSHNSSLTRFSIASASINHIPVAPPGTPTDTIIANIDQVIGVLGLHLTGPVNSTDPQSGSVTSGPLVLEFRGSNVEDSLLSPTVGAVSQLESTLTKYQQAGSDCSKVPQLLYNLNGSLNAEINLSLAIAGGSGALDFFFGGASAGVQDLPNFANPFGAGGIPLPLPNSLGGLGAAGNSTVTNPVAGPSSAPSSSSGPNPATSRVPGTNPAPVRTQSVAGVVVCQTTSPARSPGCWRGLGAAAALGTVALGAGLLAADVVYSRRRRVYPRRGMGRSML